MCSLPAVADEGLQTSQERLRLQQQQQRDLQQLQLEQRQRQMQRGSFASRPYLISSPAARKSLDIRIEEGYIEAIELADQSLPVSLNGAFPGMLGEPPVPA